MSNQLLTLYHQRLAKIMQLKSSVDIKQRTESRVCVSVNVNKVLPYLDVKGRNLHVRGEILCSRFS